MPPAMHVRAPTVEFELVRSSTSRRGGLVSIDGARFHSRISRSNARCWGGGREAEGGGLLNRYTGKTRIEGSNPSLPVREPAERRALVLTATADRTSCHRNDFASPRR